MKREFSLLDFLQWTVSVSRHEEFRSKKEAALNGGKATANLVFELLTPPPANYPPELLQQWMHKVEKFLPNEQDIKVAQGAMQWVRQLSAGDMKKWFRANIFNIVAYGKVSRQTAGLAASILDAYDKAADTRQIRYERKKKRSDTIRKFKEE